MLTVIFVSILGIRAPSGDHCSQQQLFPLKKLLKAINTCHLTHTFCESGFGGWLIWMFLARSPGSSSLPGPHSSEGLNGAGGIPSQGGSIPHLEDQAGCWQEVSVPHHAALSILSLWHASGFPPRASGPRGSEVEAAILVNFRLRESLVIVERIPVCLSSCSPGANSIVQWSKPGN